MSDPQINPRAARVSPKPSSEGVESVTVNTSALAKTVSLSQEAAAGGGAEADRTMALSQVEAAGLAVSTHPAKEPPAVIAEYQRGRPLGSGGMAMVYEAVHLRLGRTVALKLLKPQIADDPDFNLRFIREAHAMAAVTHPNVVAIYDAGEADGFLYMALEYVPGGDLARLLKRRGTIETRDALAILIGCCKGLVAIHAAGLVHRDIKPQNIFLDRAAVPKIGDLGLARSADGGDRMTLTGTSWGTPAYMSPEQIKGIADIDIRSDVYALGATLFTLLTGVEPFSGPTSYVVTHKVLSDPVPDARAHNQLIPPEVAAIIAKTMAKDRAHRYASPVELLQDLERAAGGQRLLHAASPTQAPDAPARTPSDRALPVATRAGGRVSALPTVDPLVFKTLGMLAVGGLLGLVWWSMQGKVGVTNGGAKKRDPAWASEEGKDVYGRWADLTLADTRVRFRFCPPGSFLMGSPASEPGRDANENQHQVTISHGFWMMANECPQALYQEVMHRNPSAFPDPQRPVENVNWNESVEFCATLSQRVPDLAARLPSEAEWEYACRAGERAPFASTATIAEQGWTAKGALLDAWRKADADGAEAAARRVCAFAPDDPELRPHTVALLHANAWGLFDLHGNVLEWCADAWDGHSSYPEANATDPEETRGGSSVCRGGSWFQPPERARSAARSGLPPKTAASHLGFRLVISVK